MYLHILKHVEDQWGHLNTHELTQLKDLLHLPYFLESSPPQNPVYTRENSCTFVPFSIVSAFMVTIHPQLILLYSQLHIDIHITSPCDAIPMNRWLKLLELKRVDVVTLVKCTNVVGNYWQ